MIVTEEFSIAPSATAALLARQWLGRRWPFMVLPAAAALVAGMADVRFLVVALMLVFLIWPMALCFVWFGRALDADAVQASRPHRVSFSPDGITVLYGERDGYPSPAARHVSRDEVVSVDDAGRYVVFRLAGGRQLPVPAAVLDASQWRQVRLMLAVN